MREELDMTVVGCSRSFALTLAYGFQTVEIPNRGMAVPGRTETKVAGGTLAPEAR